MGSHWIKTITVLAMLTGIVVAGDTSKDSKASSQDVFRKCLLTDQDLFREDTLGVQVLGGALFSPIGSGSTRPVFNYAPVITRFSWMLNTPEGDEWYRGNVEAVFDLFTAGIFNGFGDVIVGPTGLVRYNFVQPGWKVVPYIQAGAGVVYTNAYENKSQRLIGQAVEFTPQASIGARWMLDKNWAVTPEFMFHHISNRDMASRNVGVNAIGGFIGVSYLFDPINSGSCK